MSLNTKIGALVKYVKNKETICLTNDEARHIYKKVEVEDIFNADTIKQDIEDKLSKDNIYDDEVNPYHNIIINDIDVTNTIIYLPQVTLGILQDTYLVPVSHIWD